MAVSLTAVAVGGTLKSPLSSLSLSPPPVFSLTRLLSPFSRTFPSPSVSSHVSKTPIRGHVAVRSSFLGSSSAREIGISGNSGILGDSRISRSVFCDKKTKTWDFVGGGSQLKRRVTVFAATSSSVTPSSSSSLSPSPSPSGRQFILVGGKGGVGKTSAAGSLAVRFALTDGLSTLLVSTDPAHSLSDSFAQDVTGGLPVAVDGTDGLLFAMEIDPEQAREEFRSATKNEDGSSGVKDFMDGMGLGGWADQLSELKLGELLDSPPPGLDEAVAIAKVVQFLQAPEYSHFSRIVFDTAPTGHTLRLLSLPDFLDASIGKILKLKQKLSSATSAIKSVFGQGGPDGVDRAADKLAILKERMLMVREIFRNKESTEFVIVTIPTVMAVSESIRLLSSLQMEDVPVKRLIVNQIMPPSTSDCKFCRVRRKDQLRALDMVRSDPGLQRLKIIEAPLFDLEIRGVPALKFMGDIVWKS